MKNLYVADEEVISLFKIALKEGIKVQFVKKHSSSLAVNYNIEIAKSDDNFTIKKEILRKLEGKGIIPESPIVTKLKQIAYSYSK